MAMILGRSTPDPGIGSPVELSCRDARGLLDLIRVGKALSSQRITPEEARQAVESGKAIIVDVRDEASYKAGHVKGARWILADDIGSRVKELPHDKLIITYCS